MEKGRNHGITTPRGLAALAAVFAAAVCLMTAPEVFAQGPSVTVSPLLVQLSGERGSTLSFDVTLVNEHYSESVDIRAFVTGLRETRRGSYEPAPDGIGRFDASSWIELERQELTLRPGDWTRLAGQVRVPRDAPPSGFAALVIEAVPPDRPAGIPLAVHFSPQIVVAVEITVGRQHRQLLEISELRVVPASASADVAARFGQDTTMFAATLTNAGDIHVAARGELILRGRDGRRVRSVPLGSGRGVIIPGATVDAVSVLRALPPGDYEMEVRVHYGAGRPVVARMPFSIAGDTNGQATVIGGRTVLFHTAPSQILLEIPRHGHRTASITVRNDDNVDVAFSVSVAHLLHDEGGQPVLADRGEQRPYSAAPWTTVRPAQFTLRPGQRRNVLVSFRVPEGQPAGGRYALIRVQGRPVAGGESESVVSESYVEAMLTLGQGAVPEFVLEEVEWGLIPGTNRLGVGMTLFNGGSVHGEVAGFATLQRYVPRTEEEVGDLIIVREAQWEAVERQNVRTGTPVLPANRRFVLVEFDSGLQPGWYRIAVDIPQPDGSSVLRQQIGIRVDDSGRVQEGHPDD
ncbi:MAG: hypothetical protein H0Z37_00710 [Firmicutes bacterium]|nr:hypothetical protein [Bacillota bacterium]